MDIFNKFYRQAPMKYYQPTDYKKQQAQDMIENVDNMYIATQKSDGEWCRIIIDDDKIIAQSRNISKVTGEYGDKTELIPHIINECKNFPNGTVLLGELCFDEITSTAKDVGSILRCKPALAISRQQIHPLVFKMFDCLAWNGTDLSDSAYMVRFAAIEQIAKTYNQLQYIQMCNYTMTDFSDFLQDILSRGGEGIVIHSKEYIYKPGGRPSWKTLKVKKITQELELPVLRTIEPNKLYEGKELETWKYWLGTYMDTGQEVRIDHEPGNIDKEYMLKWIPCTKPYWMRWKNGIVVNNNGVEVRVASGLSDIDREWLATEEAQTLIDNGELYAVVSAMEITPDGSLRHPRLVRLREDM